MSNVSENLFQAMDIIISERLSGLEYDKTILCKITDDSNKAKGEYTVTDGSSTFLAISKDASYAKDTSVYVTVPKGDFNQQKLIIGRYVGENEEFSTYQPPSDLYINITENLVDEDVQTGLVANGKILEKTIWSWSVEQGQGFRGYTRLGFSAKFRSWLAAMKLISGTYGIRIDIEGTEKTTSQEPDVTKQYKYFLTSDDFYGDPYNFDVFYKQEKIFDISYIEEITHIQITFFQDAGSFIDIDKKVIPAVDEGGNSLIENLFVSEVDLSIGYATEDFSEDTVLLYTFDSKTYAPESEHSVNSNGRPCNEKTLKARWIHFNEEGQCIAIDSEAEMKDYEEQGAKVHWYKHVLKDGVVDDLAGNFWEEVNNGSDSKNLLYTFNPDITAATQSLKVIIENPSRELAQEQLDDELYDYYQDQGCSNPDDETALEKWLASLTEEKREEITAYVEELRVSIMSRVKYYESDIFVFENEVKVPDQSTLELVKGLKIVVDPFGFNGNYCIYNTSNEIINRNESFKLRPLEATYNSLITNDPKLDKASLIRWKIPGIATMIEAPVYEREYTMGVNTIMDDSKRFKIVPNRISKYDGAKLIDENNKLILQDDGYYIIERNGTENYDEKDVDGDGVADTTRQISVNQLFSIKPYYTPSAINNTIYCQVVKNGLLYEAETTLAFGPQGTNGSDCTLLLKFSKDDGTPFLRRSIIGRKEDFATIEAHLYDYQNKEVQINEIEWKWMEYDIETKTGIKKGVCSDGNIDIGERGSFEIDRPVGDINGSYNDIGFEEMEKIKINTVKLIPANGKTDFPLDVPIMHNILQATVKYGYATVGKQAQAGKDFENTDNNGNPAELEEKVQEREIVLTAYLPIGYCDSSYLEDDLHPELPDRIIYDDQGKNPAYFKDPFKMSYYNYYPLRNWITSVRLIIDDDTPGNSIYYPRLEYKDANKNSGIESGWYLIPPSMYLNNLSKKITLEVKYKTIFRDEVTFYQPILVMQNRWPSAMLNAWDGSLTIDEKNGTILSTMMGAGKKEADNTFTGVLVGDIATGAGYNNKETGVYGFNHGQQSFGFKEDGTAFIGKAGKGQIQFDGNSGLIQSMSFAQSKGKSGMKIDLDDGIIEMHGATRSGVNDVNRASQYAPTGSLIKLNVADNGDEPYLQIKTASEDDPLDNNLPRTIMSVGREEYYLQSADFKAAEGDNSKSGSGVKLDLGEGKLLGYDFQLKSVDSDTGSYFHMNSNGDPYLKIHHVDGTGEQSLDILNIGKSNFVFRTPDYNFSGSADDKLRYNSGMEFDLMRGHLRAYNDFDISSYDPHSGSYIRIGNGQSGKPYLRVHHADSSKSQNLDIVNITPSAFVLRSHDWGSKKGVELNMTNGRLTAYSFNMHAYHDNGKSFIQINSSAANNPFNVNNGFTVDWDGSFKGAGGKFSVDKDGKFKATEGVIGPFNFENTKMYTGSSSFGAGGIFMNNSGDMSLGTSFKYTASTGNLGLWKANIHDMVADGGTIGNARINKATIDGGTIGSAAISKGTIRSVDISDCDISSCRITSSLQLQGSTVSKQTINYVSSIDSFSCGATARSLVYNVSAGETTVDNITTGGTKVINSVTVRRVMTGIPMYFTLRYTTGSITVLATKAELNPQSAQGTGEGGMIGYGTESVQSY